MQVRALSAAVRRFAVPSLFAGLAALAVTAFAGVASADPTVAGARTPAPRAERVVRSAPASVRPTTNSNATMRFDARSGDMSRGRAAPSAAVFFKYQRQYAHR